MTSDHPVAGRVLIAGGGIGGLAAGIALQQRGIATLVCERAPELREVGAGLLLSPNAVRVLRRLGLEDAARAGSRVIEEWRILDLQGRHLHRMRPVKTGIPALSLHRGDLQLALRDALTPGTLRLGFNLTHHREIPGGVEITNETGERLTGEILVGADGLNSRVRSGLLAPEPARFCGYVGWRCVVPWIPRGYEGAWLSESWGEGKRFGISPLGRNRCYWYATANQARASSAPVDVRSELMAMFGRWHAPIPELIAATPAETILRTDIFDRPDLSRWTRGRVTLLGDAAHPMTPNLGQGACSALEDAWVLAREMASAANGTEGLRRYEEARHRRTSWINRVSRLLGRVIQLENPAATAVRDTLLRLTPGACSDWAMRPLFRFDG
ncbi:MAG: 2-polyprenyl-6-methoxyphenol hydroxylase [Verrucomicrobia bacterium]|nr:2-polyprenyl-6-methoxyphenol hydroxylase [Verrucomicrobiota bacterium]